MSPLETDGLGKMLHIFAISMGMLERLPIILENLTFPCIIAFFLNKILLEIRTFSIFLKNLLSHQVYDLMPFSHRLFDMEYHFYERAYDKFQYSIK